MHQAPDDLPKKCSGKLCSSCLNTKKINLSVLFCLLRRKINENSFLLKKKVMEKQVRESIGIIGMSLVILNNTWFLLVAKVGRIQCKPDLYMNGRAKSERFHPTLNWHTCTKQKRTDPTSRYVHAVRKWLFADGMASLNVNAMQA